MAVEFSVQACVLSLREKRLDKCIFSYVVGCCVRHQPERRFWSSASACASTSVLWLILPLLIQLLFVTRRQVKRAKILSRQSNENGDNKPSGYWIDNIPYVRSSDARRPMLLKLSISSLGTCFTFARAGKLGVTESLLQPAGDDRSGLVNR